MDYDWTAIKKIMKQIETKAKKLNVKLWTWNIHLWNDGSFTVEYFHNTEGLKTGMSYSYLYISSRNEFTFSKRKLEKIKIA